MSNKIIFWIVFLGCFILAVIYYQCLILNKPLHNTTKSEFKPFIVDELDFQNELKLAREGNLKSAERVTIWYHKHRNQKEAELWEKITDDIRIKNGLPTRAQVLKSSSLEPQRAN